MRTLVLLSFSVATAAPVWAAEQRQPPCPSVERLPQLAIRDIDETAVPVIDRWQIYLDETPLSDAQVARMAGDPALIERTVEEMESRGIWVFTGIGLAAAGTAASSVGWVLLGRNELDQAVTLPIAIGGVVLGMAGVLLMSHSIQSPLEPHLAPTPMHRLSKEEARRLVASINAGIVEKACPPEAAAPGPRAVDEEVPNP